MSGSICLVKAKQHNFLLPIQGKRQKALSEESESWKLKAILTLKLDVYLLVWFLFNSIVFISFRSQQPFPQSSLNYKYNNTNPSSAITFITFATFTTHFYILGQRWFLHPN